MAIIRRSGFLGKELKINYQKKYGRILQKFMDLLEQLNQY